MKIKDLTKNVVIPFTYVTNDDNKLIVQPFFEMKLYQFNEGKGRSLIDSFRMNNLTNKGYYSKKKIVLDVDFKTMTIDNRKFYVLDENTYYDLKTQYNVKGKLYDDPHTRVQRDKAIGIIELAKRIDPHCIK